MADLIGYKQLQAIITEIMAQEDYPSWSLVNGVLSCEKVLGDFDLWFHWGHLLIVPKEDKYSGKTAGDFQELDDWNTMPDGTIELFGRDWGDD